MSSAIRFSRSRTCTNGALTATSPLSSFWRTSTSPVVPSVPVTVQANVPPFSAVMSSGQSTDSTRAPTWVSTVLAMNFSPFSVSTLVPPQPATSSGQGEDEAGAHRRDAIVAATIGAPPTTRVRLEHDERREQILAAARRLFSERPPGEVSATDVAREAGVARGLLHHYFGTQARALPRGRPLDAALPGRPRGRGRPRRRPSTAGSRWSSRNRAAWLAARCRRSDPDVEAVVDAARERGRRAARRALRRRPPSLRARPARLLRLRRGGQPSSGSSAAASPARQLHDLLHLDPDPSERHEDASHDRARPTSSRTSSPPCATSASASAAPASSATSSPTAAGTRTTRTLQADGRARLARRRDPGGVRRQRRRPRRPVPVPGGDDPRAGADRRLRRDRDRRRRLRALRHRGAEAGDARAASSTATSRRSRCPSPRPGSDVGNLKCKADARERLLRPQRPEDVDLRGAPGRAHPGRLPHGLERLQARGHVDDQRPDATPTASRSGRSRPWAARSSTTSS